MFLLSSSGVSSRLLRSSAVCPVWIAMAARHHQWRETTGEDTAAVCRWLASQVRCLMKRVEQLEHPELKVHAMHAELLVELDRQRVKGERLAAAAASCAPTGKAAVEDVERLAVGVTSVETGHDVEHTTMVQSEVAKDTMPTTMEPAKELHESRHAEWTYESLKKEGRVASPPGKGGIHVATTRVKSLPLRKDTTSDATLRSGTSSPRRRCQLRPAREGNGRAWEGRLHEDCGVWRAERRCHRYDAHWCEALE